MSYTQRDVPIALQDMYEEGGWETVGYMEYGPAGIPRFAVMRKAIKGGQ